MRTELPDEIRERISEIRSDNTSGAAALSRKAAEIFILLAEGANFSREALAEAAQSLVNAQPTMASVFNLANDVLLNTEQAPDLKELRECVKSSGHAFINRLERAGELISRTAANLILGGMRVLTHSYSDTVLRALLSASRAGKQFEVVCTESRPVREGLALAKRLGQEGIRVTVVIDAAVLSQMRGADLVLSGADAVCLNGLVNKAGTSMVALAARKLRKDLYALGGSDKFLPAKYPLPAELPKDPTEILNESLPNVGALNLYFDSTPLAWFTGVVTEEGVLNPAALRERLCRMKVHRSLV